MKTIKIIDLLNKIAKGEEVPRKIKYKDVYYEKENGNFTYFNGVPHNTMSIDTYELNEEVEIIEEEKEIEQIIYDEDCTYEWSIKELYEKVYELIDAVNELKRGN